MKKRISVVFMALVFLLGLITIRPEVSSAASANGNFDVVYQVQSSWNAGATVKITIKNKGTTAVNGWTLDFKFPGDQKIGNAWNCSYTQNGSLVTIKDAGYNGYIAPGSSIEIGMNISFTGSNVSPRDFKVNSQKANSGSETPTVPAKPETPVSKPKFHVFLLLGQSNMAGYPKAQASDKEDKRFLPYLLRELYRFFQSDFPQ